MTATAGAACSTSTAEPAPRDSASMASAPVPANRSSTRAPSTRSPSTPNSASLTRSLVGRVSRPGTARNRLPPRSPPDNPHGTTSTKDGKSAPHPRIASAAEMLGGFGGEDSPPNEPRNRSKSPPLQAIGSTS